ncbi:MAG: MATE family efflux transporter [Cellulosilyticaceae bacterium]
MDKETLLTEKTRTLFYKYLVVTVFANLTHALYVLVDLLCIGIGVGSEALAAVNIALPIFTVYTAIALCAGVGGATTMSLLIGRGEGEKSKKIFTLASFLVIGTGIVLGVLGTVGVKPLARMLGATDEILPLVTTYLIPINLSCVFFMYSHMLQVFLRNDNNPKLAMIASITGSLFNIIFDVIFIFIFDMGIIGAALPTAISPIIVILIMSIHFKSDKCQLGVVKNSISWVDLKNIVQNGLGVFLLELMAGASIFIFNIVLAKNYGTMSVAVYAVMANFMYVGKSVYNGIAQAAQPIISVNEGAGLRARALSVTNIACRVALGIGIVCFITIVLLPQQTMGVFTNDRALIEYGAPYLGSYFICLIFAGVNTVFMYYFQSIGRPYLSMITSLFKGFLFIIIGLALLMPVLGLNGIYLTTGFSELVTFIIIGCIYGVMYFKRDKKESSTIQI